MNIHYFGEIADKTNCTQETIDFEIKTLDDLVIFLKEKYNLSLSDIHIAINHKLVSLTNNVALELNDEIAVLSPFAGG